MGAFPMRRYAVLPTSGAHPQEARMTLKSNKLRGSVIVITGASSGIGRTAAAAFAEYGASVVLAARRTQALRDVAVECESTGGRALVVPTDVTEERAVRELARCAIERFGRIDVWINNAGVVMTGRIEEVPSEAF